MDTKIVDHIDGFERGLQQRWPKLPEQLLEITEKGPRGWEEMLDECDLLFHEERSYAVAHERLHSDEIVTIERALEHWAATPELKRYAVYSYLMWLKKLRQEEILNRPVDKVIGQLEVLAAKTLPPKSPD
jgi:hypothetical protein